MHVHSASCKTANLLVIKPAYVRIYAWYEQGRATAICMDQKQLRPHAVAVRGLKQGNANG